MTPNDEEKFATLMFSVGEYYGKPYSDGVVELFWRALESMDYEDVARAVSRHMSDPDSGQFPPKIADIKRHVEGSKTTQAMQAWTKVDKAVRRVGPWESVTFDDPIIMRVLVDMGGWTDMCNTPTEKDFEFKMHEFSKRYQGYLLQGGVNEYPRMLTGYFNAENAKNGHDTQPPLLLGNEKKAQLIYEQGKASVGIEYKRAEEVAQKLLADMKSDEGAA